MRKILNERNNILMNNIWFLQITKLDLFTILDE